MQDTAPGPASLWGELSLLSVSHYSTAHLHRIDELMARIGLTTAAAAAAAASAAAGCATRLC
jgi:hypothetical protein